MISQNDPIFNSSIDLSKSVQNFSMLIFFHHRHILTLSAAAIFVIKLIIDFLDNICCFGFHFDLFLHNFMQICSKLLSIRIREVLLKSYWKILWGEDVLLNRFAPCVVLVDFIDNNEILENKNNVPIRLPLSEITIYCDLCRFLFFSEKRAHRANHIKTIQGPFFYVPKNPHFLIYVHKLTLQTLINPSSNHKLSIITHKHPEIRSLL